MSPASQSQLDMYDARGDVAGFLVGLGFRRDGSGPSGAHPGRFVIEKGEHGALLSVTVEMAETWTVVTVARPVWIMLPGTAERWFRGLVREVGGRGVQWARDGHRAQVEVPTSRAAYFLRVLVPQEVGWAWRSIGESVRQTEARR